MVLPSFNLCTGLDQIDYLLPHILTLCSRAGCVNTRQEMSVESSGLLTWSWLLVYVCTFMEFCNNTANRRVWRLVLFQNTLKTYAWCISCQLQTYASVMMVISHPAVIYLWLFGLIWGKGQGPLVWFMHGSLWNTRALVSMLNFTPEWNIVFLTRLNNHIT